LGCDVARRLELLANRLVLVLDQRSRTNEVPRAAGRRIRVQLDLVRDLAPRRAVGARCPQNVVVGRAPRLSLIPQLIPAVSGNDDRVPRAERV